MVLVEIFILGNLPEFIHLKNKLGLIRLKLSLFLVFFFVEYFKDLSTLNNFFNSTFFFIFFSLIFLKSNFLFIWIEFIFFIIFFKVLKFLGFFSIDQCKGNRILPIIYLIFLIIICCIFNNQKLFSFLTFSSGALKLANIWVINFTNLCSIFFFF